MGRPLSSTNPAAIDKLPAGAGRAAGEAQMSSAARRSVGYASGVDGDNRRALILFQQCLGRDLGFRP
jgi:hypothetical protein